MVQQAGEKAGPQALVWNNHEALVSDMLQKLVKAASVDSSSGAGAEGAGSSTRRSTNICIASLKPLFQRTSDHQGVQLRVPVVVALAP